jgi:hypothetical protein
MPLNNGWKEFIALLNSYGVEYLIVGAHSLAFHARPRFTGDLDILIRPTPENATKIVAVLNEFRFGNLGASASDFTTPEQLIQLGRALTGSTSLRASLASKPTTHLQPRCPRTWTGFPSFS